MTQLMPDNYSELWEYTGPEAKRRFLLSPFLGQEYQSKLRIGRLKVKVLEAVNLPGVVMSKGSATANPYVAMRMEGRAWRNATKRHNLNPSWLDDNGDVDHVYFYVHRHDAKLTVEVCDEGEHHDDRLGFVEIQVAKLAGHGTLRRFFLLKSHLLDAGDALISAQYANSNAAIQLELEYDVSPIGEAASFLWLPPPEPPKEKPPFDAQVLYKNCMAFKAEMTPYLQFNTALQSAIRWNDVDISRTWFLVAIFLALCWRNFFMILHFWAVYKLGKNYIAARRIADIKRIAALVFIRIDTDKNGTLSREEITKAIDELIKRGKCIDKPKQKDIDTLFRKYAKTNSELSLNDFVNLLMNCPQFVGHAGVLLTRARQDKPEDTSARTRFADGRQGSEDDFDDVLNDAEEQSNDDFTEQNLEIKDATVRARFVQEATAEKKISKPGFKNTVVKNLLNRIGRRISFLAFMSRQFGSMAKDLALLRRVFAWDPAVASLSKAAVFGNLFLALVQRAFPTLYFLIMVSMAFFFYSEKRRALERILHLGSVALKRHNDLRDKKNLDKDILIDDGRPQQPKIQKSSITTNPLGGAARLLLPLSGGSIDVRSAVFDSVVRNVFSRLDKDNSHSVSHDELVNFVLAALPRATATLRNKCQATRDTPDIDAIKEYISKIIDTFDKDGDSELSYTEFFAFVTSTGCSRLLIQDEIRRQLLTTGVSCLKLPSRAAPSTAQASANPSAHKPTPSSSSHIFGSHHTHIALTKDGKSISYSNRHGHPIILGEISAITAHPDRPNILRIYYKNSSKVHSKTLILSISDQLRDGLVDVLQYELHIEGSPASLPAEATTPTQNMRTSSSSPHPAKNIPSRPPKLTKDTSSSSSDDVSRFAALSG
uniref:Uncharacterized protein n=1 Tax=Aureoumbra lagunensis TaxID=44058 RepID=A0A7S3K578_9STRA